MKRQLHIRPTENGWFVVEQHTDDMRGLCGKEWSFESTAALVRELAAILEPDKASPPPPSKSMGYFPSKQTNVPPP